tara:strand:+ start:264 stop:1352 length:1089 start_codon:yes stop_codon:yes gene_type:complete
VDIAIIGGGTAGWWTAAYFEKHTDYNIMQYESPEVHILGVGESTLPQIKQFFLDLNLNTEDWFDECQAVLKFANVKTGWDDKFGKSFPIKFCYNDEKTDCDYAYHICAEQSGKLMKYICKRTEIREEHLKTLPEGFDLYIDCTGLNRVFVKDFTKMKIGQHYIDSTWVCPIKQDGEIKEYTESIARDYGWQFRIHLQNRIGTGYAYSSKHITDDDALSEFLSMDTGWLKKPKNIKWTPLVLSNPWTDNVVAMGSSAGFVDPLDATALFNLQAGIVNLVNCLKRGYKNKVYNRMMRRIWKDSLTFIECQYGLNQRKNTSFWNDCEDREKYSSILWNRIEYQEDPKLNIFPSGIWKQQAEYLNV